MKTINTILAATVIMITASCSSTYQAGKADDVYYSTKDPVPAPAPVPSTAPAPSQENYDYGNNNYNNDNSGYQDGQNQQYDSQNDNSNSSQYSDGQGNTYVTNNYNGDYYDYEYSSRIRRFYEPVYGFGFYDPFYTNSYWYNYRPASWGVSIYLGYNWWAPSHFYTNPFNYGGWGFGAGFGYGSPYGGFGYPFYPHYGFSPYPYYGGFGGYNHGYHHGYQNGYWNGYNDGFYGGNPNPYYYNSYDANSYYYGPRGSTGSNSPRAGAQRQSMVAPLSAKYEDAIESGKITRSTGSETLPTGVGRVRDDKNNISPTQNNQGTRDGGRNNSTSPQPANGVSRDGKNNTISPSQQGTTRPDTRQKNQNNGTLSPSQQGTTKPDQRQNTTPDNGTISPSTKPSTRPDQRQNTNPSVQPDKRPDQRQNQVTPQPSTRPDQRQNQNQAPSRQYDGRNPKSSDRTPLSKPGQNQNSQQNQRNTDYDKSKFSNRQNADRNQTTPREYEPKSGRSGQKSEDVRDNNSTRKQMESSPRQEKKTPIFQPRNEPRQYRQDAPTSPSPQSTPQNNGGRRR